ncbi:MAG: heavy-metal-associated domain-containing protein [Ignavibacteria bacterium]
MKSEKIQIKGMSCMHCVKEVKNKLSKLNINVKNVGIGSAEVEYDDANIKREEILKAIKEAGYIVKE